MGDKPVSAAPERIWIDERAVRAAELLGKSAYFLEPFEHGIKYQNADIAASQLQEKEKEIERLRGELQAAMDRTWRVLPEGDQSECLRCLQYDAIVRGVCRDLGIDEGAGCDEIAMVSANARELRANQEAQLAEKEHSPNER